METLTEIEVWKDIPGYEGYYQVSSLSRVRSVDRLVPRSGFMMNLKGIILTPTISGNGYLNHRLAKDAIQITMNVHRAVADAFIPKVDGKNYVNHIDGNKINNSIKNLEWVTCSENLLHAFETGLKLSLKLTDHFKARPLIQLDLAGNFIKRYECCRYAIDEHGYDSGAISKACHGKLKTAYGFKWKFEDNLTNYERWQLKKKKNILSEFGNPIKECEPGATTSEINYAYTLETESK